MAEWWAGLKSWQKWTLGVIGAYALKLILDGLVAAVLAPGFVWLRDVALNVTTYGIRSAKNLIYARIARTTPPDTATQILGILMGGALVITLSNWRKLRRRIQATLAEQSQVEASTKTEVQTPTRRTDKLMVQIVAVYLIIIGIYMLSYVATDEYIRAAIVHYNQMKTIDAPYLTLAEREKIDSEFAQMTTSEEYYRIIDRLKAVADANNLRYPTFAPW